MRTLGLFISHSSKQSQKLLQEEKFMTLVKALKDPLEIIPVEDERTKNRVLKANILRIPHLRTITDDGFTNMGGRVNIMNYLTDYVKVQPEEWEEETDEEEEDKAEFDAIKLLKTTLLNQELFAKYDLVIIKGDRKIDFETDKLFRFQNAIALKEVVPLLVKNKKYLVLSEGDVTNLKNIVKSLYEFHINLKSLEEVQSTYGVKGNWLNIFQ